MARAKKPAKKRSAARPRPRSRKPAKAAKRMAPVVVVDSGPEIEVAAKASEVPLLLPDCLDSDASLAVRDSLLQRRGQPLVIDASQVRRVGAQSLQILIAAARTWQADGHGLSIANPSSELLDSLALVGLSRAEMLLEGTAL